MTCSAYPGAPPPGEFYCLDGSDRSDFPHGGAEKARFTGMVPRFFARSGARDARQGGLFDLEGWRFLSLVLVFSYRHHYAQLSTSSQLSTPWYE